MKNIKSYIKSVALMTTVAAALTACQDDIDAPGVNVPVPNVEPNTTILELKETFWDEATNYAKTIEDPDDPSHRYVIHGRVISSDEEGNVFKSLVIQDETAAMAFSIDSYNLYLKYRVGQDIVLDVTGMDIGKYAGLQQIGRKSWYENGNTDQVSFMSLEYFQNYAQLDGLPLAADIDTLQVNSFSEISTTPEGLRKWQSQLVRFRNVSFTEGGQRKFSAYHATTNEEQNTTLQDRNGATLTVRTSGYCTFWNETLPVGNIDLVGILSYYNTAWQIIMIDGNGVIKVGERPGTKENPYTVEGAIADQAAGVSGSGWIKGYIVGAVAPEVSTVTSNNDIEWSAPTVLGNSLVIAPTPTTSDFSKCLVVMLPSGSKLQEVGNLSTNASNLGKEIMINGTLGAVMGTYGITGVTGAADSFSIEGVEVGGSAIPDGDGQEATPYNVSQVIAKNPTSTQTAVESGVWVKGYIVGYMPTGGSSTLLSATVFGTDGATNLNLVIGPTADCTDASKCVGVQLPVSMRDVLALANVPGNLGKALAVKGDIMKYCGGPGVKNLSAYNLEGGVTPPDKPTETPSGTGTEADPYNGAAARAAAAALAADATGDNEVYVKGKIIAIKEVSTQFGNATYTIGDEQGQTGFSVFRGLWLDGAKFTSTDQIAVGGEVVVRGKLTNYKGNTPQMAQGSTIISYDGSTSGGGDEPVNPSGDVVTIDASAFNGRLPGSITVDGYTIDIEKGNGATAPAYHAGSTAVRAYAKNTISVTGPKAAKIVFTIAADNSYRYTTLTPTSGKMDPAQAVGDTTATWVGDSADITFTVGDLATLGSENTKPGQFRFTKIEIYKAK